MKRIEAIKVYCYRHNIGMLMSNCCGFLLGGVLPRNLNQVQEAKHDLLTSYGFPGQMIAKSVASLESRIIIGRVV